MIEFVQHDGRGDLIGLTNGASVTQHVLYGPWGNLEAFSGDSLPQTRLGWKGLVWEGGTAQLYYVRSRWYDPQSQSFLSEDPLGLSGGRNTYAYADNDPVNGWDPSGLTMDDPGCLITFEWKFFPETGYMVEGTLHIIGMTPECTKPAAGRAGGRGGGGSVAHSGNHKVKYTRMKPDVCSFIFSPTLRQLLNEELAKAQAAGNEYGGYGLGTGVNTKLDSVSRSAGLATQITIPWPGPVGTRFTYHTHLSGPVPGLPDFVYDPGPDSADSTYAADNKIVGIVVSRGSFFIQVPAGTAYGCSN
jgi:RHS repeat-associated protein